LRIAAPKEVPDAQEGPPCGGWETTSCELLRRGFVLIQAGVCWLGLVLPGLWRARWSGCQRRFRRDIRCSSFALKRGFQHRGPAGVNPAQAALADFVGRKDRAFNDPLTQGFQVGFDYAFRRIDSPLLKLCAHTIFPSCEVLGGRTQRELEFRI